jgi:broad specificity phosphatase PhoE
MRLIVLRHGESKKNQLNIIGGTGAPLTARGRLCSRHTASRIRSLKCKPSHIYCAPTVQTSETGYYINSSLPKSELLISELLKPIRLGRLSGSTTARAHRNSARDMISLEAWNQGLIDISQITIEGMQSPWDFYRSGLAFISEVNTATNCACVVATRSTLILLWHIKKRRTPDLGGGYTNKQFPYHRPFILNFNIQDLIWIRQRQRKNGTSQSSAS